MNHLLAKEPIVHESIERQAKWMSSTFGTANKVPLCPQLRCHESAMTLCHTFFQIVWFGYSACPMKIRQTLWNTLSILYFIRFIVDISHILFHHRSLYPTQSNNTWAFIFQHKIISSETILWHLHTLHSVWTVNFLSVLFVLFCFHRKRVVRNLYTPPNWKRRQLNHRTIVILMRNYLIEQSIESAQNKKQNKNQKQKDEQKLMPMKMFYCLLYLMCVQISFI